MEFPSDVRDALLNDGANADLTASAAGTEEVAPAPGGGTSVNGAAQEQLPDPSQEQAQDTIKMFRSIKYWRMTLKDLPISDLERIEGNVHTVVEECRAAAAAAEEHRKEKAKVIAMIWEKMRENDLTLEDFGQGAPIEAPSRSRRSAPIKYRCGENAWTGQGRTPRWLTELIEQGHGKEEYLVGKASATPDQGETEVSAWQGDGGDDDAADRRDAAGGAEDVADDRGDGSDTADSLV